MENKSTKNDLQLGLEIVELEERLEMVQLSAVVAASLRCDSASSAESQQSSQL